MCWLASLVGTSGGICATVSAGLQCVVTRFARRYLWGICAAVSVGSQGVVAFGVMRETSCATAGV